MQVELSVTQRQLQDCDLFYPAAALYNSQPSLRCLNEKRKKKKDMTECQNLVWEGARREADWRDDVAAVCHVGNERQIAG